MREGGRERERGRRGEVREGGRDGKGERGGKWEEGREEGEEKGGREMQSTCDDALTSTALSRVSKTTSAYLP